MIFIFTPAKFPLGQIVITSNALNRLTQADINDGIQRHASGDWGKVCPDDAALNNEALTSGGRVLSSFGSDDQTFWIITEGDRSVTTVLLLEDY